MQVTVRIHFSKIIQAEYAARRVLDEINSSLPALVGGVCDLPVTLARRVLDDARYQVDFGRSFTTQDPSVSQAYRALARQVVKSLRGVSQSVST